MLKVFISHQRHDTALAATIAARLRVVHAIESYLDVIDPYVSGSIETLGDHIRDEMAKCTQLLAVVSPATASSQWVPWEIGVATEKNFPLATYSGQSQLPPEFLRKWPYLRTDADLDQYARVSRQAERTLVTKRAQFNEGYARQTTTRQFHTDLRSALRQ